MRTIQTCGHHPNFHKFFSSSFSTLKNLNLNSIVSFLSKNQVNVRRLTTVAGVHHNFSQLSGTSLQSKNNRREFSCNSVNNFRRNFFNFYPENMPNPIVLDSTPADKPEAIVVFCHGLGDTGDGWSWAFKDPSIRNPKVKYLFPTADTQPVSLNGGFPMPSWYDLYGLSPSTKEDEAGIKKAADKINSLINTELEKYPHLTEKNVIVGGFSQGGALAFYTGLSNSKSPYGAIIGLSTYLPLRDEFLKDESAKLNAVQGTKIFQAHGDDDQVVPFQFGQLTSKVIKQTSLDAVFKSYSGMGHSSCEQEMNDVKNFISQVVLANM